MGHPTEDELIQHLCGENDPRDREHLQDHLEICTDCRLACEEITGALTMVNDAVPEPPDGFERVIWAKVQQAIALGPAPSRWTWRSLMPAGAVAALTIAGIAFVSRPDPIATVTPQPQQSVAAQDEGARDRVLYTALDNHFRQTEMLLVELRNASERDSLEFERYSAQELISDGRLYRLTAETAGHPRLVQVLDELEPVLVEVARGPQHRSANDRAWLRGRIEEDALLFKVRAATNDIRDRVAHADQ
jgi:hypothetical protein